jgi:hypothetical protein
MNISQASGLNIMAVIAVFVLTVIATPFTPAALAQNMTGGVNVTTDVTDGTNMTDTNQTGSISQLAPS